MGSLNQQPSVGLTNSVALMLLLANMLIPRANMFMSIFQNCRNTPAGKSPGWAMCSPGVIHLVRPGSRGPKQSRHAPARVQKEVHAQLC